MILTGKAKEDFDNWYINQNYELDLTTDLSPHTPVVGFDEIDDSMKYGVFVDWFDSVGMTETVELELSFMAGGHNRQRARLWAIEKQEKRYNRNKT